MPPPVAPKAALPSGGAFASIFAPLGVALDATNATREALVKASRDVTIAAKKLIFVLHRLDVATLPTPLERPLPLNGTPAAGGAFPPPCPLPPPPHAGLDAATDAAKALSRQVVTTIGSRLVSPADATIHARAFSPGLQEYVEAVVFLAWLRTGGLASRDDVQRGLDAALEAVVADASAVAAVTAAKTMAAVPATETGMPTATSAGGRKPPPPPTPSLPARRVVLSWDDYLLGVADVAGEVMRLAVAAGSGSSDAAVAVSHRAAALLQALTVAYEGLPQGAGGVGGRDGAQKLSALRASRAKVERALYTRVVRAAEFGEEVRGGGEGRVGGDPTGGGGGEGGGAGGGAAEGDAGNAVAAGGKGHAGGASGEGGGGGVKRPATTGISAAGGATAGEEAAGVDGGPVGGTSAGADEADEAAAEARDVTVAPAPKKVRVA